MKNKHFNEPWILTEEECRNTHNFALQVVIQAITEVFEIPITDGHLPTDRMLAKRKEEVLNLLSLDIDREDESDITRLSFLECGIEPTYAYKIFTSDGLLDKIKERMKEMGEDGYHSVMPLLLNALSNPNN